MWKACQVSSEADVQERQPLQDPTHLLIHECWDDAVKGPHGHTREDLRPIFRGPWCDADAAGFCRKDEETPVDARTRDG